MALVWFLSDISGFGQAGGNKIVGAGAVSGSEISKLAQCLHAASPAPLKEDLVVHYSTFQLPCE